MTSPDEFARRRGDPPPRQKSRVSFADLVALSLIAATLCVAIPAWARSEEGRAAIAHEVEQLLDGQIRGYVTIGSLDRVGMDGVTASNVIFYDESGRVVIEADEVELEVDWDELSRGHFVSPRGRVHGGRLVLETLASGELLADRAFESAHPGPPGSPIGPDVVRLERLAIDHVTVLIAVHGAREVRATRLSAIVLVRAPENGSPHVRADRIDGHLLIDAPIAQNLEIERGHFVLDGAARRRSRMDFPTHVGGEPLRVEVTVRADAHENMHVGVTLTPQSVGAVFTSGALIAQALILEAMSPALDVTVELP